MSFTLKEVAIQVLVSHIGVYPFNFLDYHSLAIWVHLFVLLLSTNFGPGNMPGFEGTVLDQMCSLSLLL